MTSFWLQRLRALRGLRLRRVSTRCALLWLCVAALACAELSPDGGDATSLALADQQPQGGPDSTQDTTPTPTPSSTAPTIAVLPAEAKTGVAVRWQRDPNKCIARKTSTPTLRDPITLNMCTDTNSQAWIVYDGYLLADNNLCVGAAAIGDALSLFPCTDANTRVWVFNGGAVNAVGTSGGLFADDANGTLGSPIRFSNYAAYDQTLANWNLTGVGTRPGALISWGTSPNQCMTQQNGALKVSGCSLTDANQRWAMLRGDLAGNANLCVIGSSSPGLAIIPCANVSNTAENNQGWFALTVMRYASTYNNNNYQLGMDAQKQNFTLIPENGGELRSRYYWGGRLINVTQ